MAMEPTHHARELALLADSTSFEERGPLFGTNDAAGEVVGGICAILAGVAFSTWGIAGLAVLGVSFAFVSLAAGPTLWRPTEMAAPVPAVDPDP